jgi:hypothetical protein
MMAKKKGGEAVSNPQQTQAGGGQPQAQHAQRAQALGVNLDEVLRVLELAGRAAPQVLASLEGLVNALRGGGGQP